MLFKCCMVSGVDCWPEGTYGLPMTDSGCPISENLYWNHGKYVYIGITNTLCLTLSTLSYRVSWPSANTFIECTKVREVS